MDLPEQRSPCSTPAEWDRIKPAILKLLARIKKKQDRDALNTRLQNRQRNLRPRYDKLKRALPASARPFVPLFINFLLLPSIKELWSELTVELNDGTWYNQLDAVKEELDQFRLDLALHARELIIAARRDPDDPDEHPTQSGPENEDEAGTPDVSHDFFARATSFVCCTFTSCHKHSTAGDDRISGVVGPLPLVLAHQHARHNQADCLSTTRLCADGPQFRIELPLEVVRAVDALIDLAKLDPATATRDDLVRFDRLVTMYEWTNTLSWKRHAAHWPWTDQAWEDLVRPSLSLPRSSAVNADSVGGPDSRSSTRSRPRPTAPARPGRRTRSTLLSSSATCATRATGRGSPCRPCRRRLFSRPRRSKRGRLSASATATAARTATTTTRTATRSGRVAASRSRAATGRASRRVRTTTASSSAGGSCRTARRMLEGQGARTLEPLVLCSEGSPLEVLDAQARRVRVRGGSARRARRSGRRRADSCDKSVLLYALRVMDGARPTREECQAAG